VKGFFSPIDKLATELPRTKGTGAEFMTELSKRPGYKPQEAQDRDLQTLMSLPKMAREEFLAKLKSKPAQELQDTVLSNEGLKPGGASNHMPKYKEHTLPGGENYREILMRLPKSQRPAKDPASGHWDQPGVLAHVRVKDRTGPNGEKLLHIEEIQSDWHQKGRDQGYETPDMLQKVEQARLQHKLLKQQLEQAKTESDSATHSLNRKEPLFQQPDVQARYEAARVRANNDIMDLMPKVMKAEVAKQAAERTHNQAIPNAPFKKNWHELALKKMIHHAAEQGYHGIVITPGKEQADRYKLSQHINDLQYDPQTKTLMAWNHNGNKVIEKSGIDESQLPDYIGKEGANKLLAKNPQDTNVKQLFGADLEVGGEGMKGFYDKMVPSFLNQFGKKYGAQVGTMPIQTKTPSIEKAGTSFYQVPGKQAVLHHFPITPEMREDVTKNGVPLYADGGGVKDIQDTARQNDAYPDIEKYLQARDALPDVQISDNLPEGTNGMFTSINLPIGSGQLKLSKNAPKQILPSVLTHEMAHAADRQMMQQAMEQSMFGKGNQFTEAYQKLVGPEGRNRTDLARNVNPDWASDNQYYRALPQEIAAHGIGAFSGPNTQSNAPKHVDATAATEFQILLDLARRNANNGPQGLAKIPAFFRKIGGYADGGNIKRYARGGMVSDTLQDQPTFNSIETQALPQFDQQPAVDTSNTGADIGLLNYSNLNAPATAIDSSATSGLNALQPTTGLSTDYASVNPLNVSNNVAQNNILNPDTLSANDLSSGYQFANSQGGIGLDQYYQNINNYLANNPSAQQLAQDKTLFGVSDADIARAQSLFPSTQTGGLPADTQPVTQPITQQPFGATDLVSQVTAWKPSTEYQFDPNNQFAHTNITLTNGSQMPYDALVQQVLSRYDVDHKNPTLAVKSGTELGIPDEILRTLPGVDDAAMTAGKALLQSGAFSTADSAEGRAGYVEAAPAGSATYNARIAAGLDAYGYPPAQVAALKAAGQYREPKTYDPAQFQQLASSNGTTPAQITQGGLKALYNAGYNSDEAAQLFNKTYGTNYTAEDYKRELNNAGLQKVDNPQLAVFGDSISAAMGFNQKPNGEGYADTSMGTNLAQYLGSNLKVYSANNSLGGSTTQDSLQGTPISFNGQQLPLEYGNFADYITQHKPETAVLRFGAADAIKLNDPDTTLKNIENMVNISNQNGTKPVLVGVTPFAKMGDFNAGNINSGITDSMIASADRINEGIRALADKYGVQFIDVRQVPVPQGGLVDGVHPSGEYGNAMAQYIANQIKSANVLPSKQNQFASNGATQHMKTGGRVKPVGYTKEKFTVSPSLDQMMYELISVKHSKKVK